MSVNDKVEYIFKNNFLPEAEKQFFAGDKVDIYENEIVVELKPNTDVIKILNDLKGIRE